MKRPASTKPPVQVIDVAAIEASLPPKHKRSHHVVVKIEKLNKSFGEKDNRVHVLKSINLNLYSGEFVIISGPSGSGKSTLLHTILGLEDPSTGSIEIRGIDVYDGLKEDDRTSYRRQKIGMVFQQSNWIKSLLVWENVAYPLWLAGIKPAAAKEQAFSRLKEVGMEDYGYKQPSELSGGQQQRVQLSRALANDPGIIIADEPTGNLDTSSASDIVRLLAKLNRAERRMVIMVTHEVTLLPLATRQIILRDGAVVYDKHT